MRIATVTVGDEGEITLPSEVCERLGVGEGDEVEFVLDDKGVHLRAIQQENNASAITAFKDMPRDEEFKLDRIQDTPPDPDL
ncbi:AbrB/MazE/SpoVT family DNA-binding domain-containing protein [Deinococcus aestuarii]|uniref:AbrB/MazE/SpoVT family DNA-binding domain-containing protein n=1 Tax=Deinococcus aestuarii TaxID=2774531 RepID=UPI001C0D1C5F|nr:AbrB/MazE/SpoVT family DNA-binding domain-containing protein [Deinococcus aestuarii]